MSKHTPGPWIIDQGQTIEGPVIRIDLPRPVDILCDSDEMTANAHLLAAAPEMLEALKQAEIELEEYIYELVSKFGSHDAQKSLQQVKAAIAKAEGRK